jgi:hypothetical protein
MSSDWARLVSTTTSNFMKGAEPLYMRKRKLPALMQSKGRIKLNSYGTKLEWKLEYKEAPLQGYADGDTLTFARRDKYLPAELGWRSYVMTDMMSQMERLQNKGPAAIVNVYSEIIPGLTKNFMNALGSQLYVDGNATGNSRKIHGIESFLGEHATLFNLGNGFAKPSDFYANLHTDPQYYGGQWTGTWPQGQGEAHYDCTSPILVNYTDATAGAYEATTKTWRNTCVQALRKGITKSQKSASQDGKLDLIFLQDELFEEFKNSQQGNQQMQFQWGDKVGLYSLGFTDVLNFDGVDVTTEFDLPASTGYGFNTEQMEMNCLNGRLIEPDGPTWDPVTRSWLFSLSFFGNCKFTPKFFVKWKNYGANP